MADASALDQLQQGAGLGFDPETLQQLQEARLTQGMGRLPGMPSQQAASQVVGNGLFAASPQMQQARQLQAASADIMANTPKGDDENELEYQIRVTTQLRDAAAKINPNAAIQLSNRLDLLRQTQIEQGRLQADTGETQSRSRYLNDQAKTLEDQEPLAQATKGLAYVVHPDEKQPLGYATQGFDISTPAGKAAFQRAAQQPGATGMSPADASRLFQLSNPAEMRMAASLAKTQAEQGGPLDPDTTHFLGVMALTNPSGFRAYVGYGQAGNQMRQAGIAEATKILKETGMKPEDVAGIQASIHAEGQSITGLTKMLNNANAFDKLVHFNGDRLLQLIGPVDTTGVPAFEGAIRYFKARGGNVDTNELRSVLNTFQVDVAKIINNPNLTGNLTNQAKQDLKDVVGGNLDAPSMVRIIKRLYAETDMRKQGVNEQIGIAQKLMNPFAPPGPAPGPAIPPAPQPGAIPADVQQLLQRYGGQPPQQAQAQPQ